MTQPSALVLSLRVLVVDDDEDARCAVECAVLSFGHSCTSARDGLEAWEMHLAARADIIISDWMMPRMNGVELCLRIRGDDPTRPYTHFIFVTGNGDQSSADEGMRSGADAYLVKPIDLDQLGATLEAATLKLSQRSILR